ncbi:MAG: purine-binding chemotaxis protein CheW [Proteobacteria bacterium]|nr:purine-binding chemotaxis protein CheW [Pseudomonadota bacterium]
MRGETLELLCFRLGERVFAVDIACIREILRSPNVTPVPRAPPQLAGVHNLRGELLPVFDLHRALLDEDPGPATEDDRLVVLRTGGQTAGVRVDQVLDVVSVRLAELQPVPGARLRESAVVAAFRSDVAGEGRSVVLLLRLSPFFAAGEVAVSGGVG